MNIKIYFVLTKNNSRLNRPEKIKGARTKELLNHCLGLINLINFMTSNKVINIPVGNCHNSSLRIFK